MTTLNTVLGTMNGPRRLRSALRQKTVVINRLLDGLSGPTELCVQIPASVFGGDIFGVMSSQLREALIVPPPPTPVVARPQRKQSLASITNSFAKRSESFLPLADWIKQSTLHNESLTAISKKALSPNQNTTENSGVSSLGPQASRLLRTATGFLHYQAGETPAVPGESTTELPAFSTAKQFPRTTPALVNILSRYWESTSERQNTSHIPSQRPSTESLATAADFPVTDVEQQTASRTWPTSVGRDVSEKLRSFSDPNRSLKPTRLSSTPDGQIQNVFNIEVNHANQLASDYSDLGERIAEILHEQALQHGIDIT